MTETADPMMLADDDRLASARSFFDVAPPVDVSLPPPTLTVPSSPQLPRTVPAAPSAVPAASPFAFSPASVTAPPSGGSNKARANGGGFRRFVSRLFLLALLGGIVFAGVKFGPDLIDRTKGESTDSEPAAPLEFPAVTPTMVLPRTASLVIEQPAADGSAARYEVTNDFETGVSRMLIDRATATDVEVLGVFDVVNLRLADQPTWWTMPRGEFPLAGGAERERWVRTIDEYFPAAMRPHVTIDQSTEALIGTETMRHLVVTVDAAAIAGTAPAAVIDPTTGLETPAEPVTAGAFVPPPSVTGTGAVVPVTIELWVDVNGIVRKLVEPAEMGARTITVVSLSSEAYSPEFPLPESTAPLTASQLVELGL